MSASERSSAPRVWTPLTRHTSALRMAHLAAAASARWIPRGISRALYNWLFDCIF